MNSLLNIDLSNLMAILGASLALGLLRLGLAKQKWQPNVIAWLIFFAMAKIVGYIPIVGALLALATPILIAILWERFNLRSMMFDFLKRYNISIDDDVQDIQERFKTRRKQHDLIKVVVYLKNGSTLSSSPEALKGKALPSKIYPFELLPNGDVCMIATHSRQPESKRKERHFYDENWGTAVTYIKTQEIERIEFRYDNKPIVKPKPKPSYNPTIGTPVSRIEGVTKKPQPPVNKK